VERADLRQSGRVPLHLAVHCPSEDAESLIDLLNHLLYLDQRWLILKRFCPDSMGDCHDVG